MPNRDSERGNVVSELLIRRFSQFGCGGETVENVAELFRKRRIR